MEIYFGGPRYLGVQKFYEGVGVVDRGHQDLSNGVKILAVRRSYLELNLIFKIILNLIFSKIKKSLFVKFSGIVEGTILYRLAKFKKN